MGWLKPSEGITSSLPLPLSIGFFLTLNPFFYRRGGQNGPIASRQVRHVSLKDCYISIIIAHHIAHQNTIGTGHAQVRLTGGGGPALDAIAVRAADTGIAEALSAAAAARQAVHAAGLLVLDDWGGRRRVKLQISDVALPV